MSTAAHVAAWEEEFGEPEFRVVSGGSDDLSHPVVELYIRGNWVDITSYVRYEDGVTIRRGKSSESSQTDTSTCMFTVDNRDGRFSPRNPLGAYYGYIGRNSPIRVGVVRNGITRYRFYGEVSDWPVNWDLTGTDAWTEIEASGIMRRLSMNTEPLRSPMYRNLTRTDVNNVVAYWSLEDPKGAASSASGLPDGIPTKQGGGKPDRGAYDNFVCSDPVITLKNTYLQCRVQPYASSGENMVRFLMHVPEGGSGGTTNLFTVTTSGTARRWDIDINASNQIRLIVFNPDGATLYSSGFVGMGSIADRQTVVSLRMTQNGGNVDFVLVFGDLDNPLAFLPISISLNTLTNSAAGTLGRVIDVVLGLQQGLNDFSFGHLAVVNATSISGEVSGNASALLGYAGENPTTRLSRICLEEGVPLQITNKNVLGNTVGLGHQSSLTFLDLFRQCVETDSGLLYEPRDQLAMGYRSRLSLFNQSPLLTLDYSAHQLAEPLRPTDDDDVLMNDVTVTNSSASADASAQAIKAAGALNVNDPAIDPQGVGRYKGSKTVNLVTDTVGGIVALGATTTLGDQAGWALHLGTVDEARYPQIKINLQHESFTSSTSLTNKALALDIGDRLDITNPPSWVPPDDINLMVQGYTEFIGGSGQHAITFVCTPETPWRVAVADETSRIDTDDSSLTSAVTDAATSISVTVSSGNPWVDTATYPDEFPFDIRVGGEVMTVTAITGSSSPQTFTVTRAVNGVVKAHEADTDVRLAQPAIISL